MRCVSGTTHGASKQTLFIMYNALIRSILDYGAIAYDSASTSTREKLDVVQGKALRICCGVMTGCARACLQIECGQPPLSLRRRRMQVDYALKIQSYINHPTATIMDDCWQNHGEYAADREPFCVKVKAVLDAVGIHDVPDTSPSTKALPPWIAPTKLETRKHLVSTYQRVADHITSLWQQQWDNDDTGRFYHAVQPIVGYIFKYEAKPRRKNVSITRLRMNKCRLAAGLHKLHIGETANCDICRVSETVQHFIVECPKQLCLQTRLKHECMRTSKQFNIKTVLTCYRCITLVYAWIVDNKTVL